jgi:hypothetical protein
VGIRNLLQDQVGYWCPSCRTVNRRGAAKGLRPGSATETTISGVAAGTEEGLPLVILN